MKYIGIVLLVLVSCKPSFDKYVIIGKEHNAKPSAWTCTCDSFTVVKDIHTNERSDRCGNLGAVGDTISERR